jgi:hypothetical protein
LGDLECIERFNAESTEKTLKEENQGAVSQKEPLRVLVKTTRRVHFQIFKLIDHNIGTIGHSGGYIDL